MNNLSETARKRAHQFHDFGEEAGHKLSAFREPLAKDAVAVHLHQLRRSPALPVPNWYWRTITVYCPSITMTSITGPVPKWYRMSITMYCPFPLHPTSDPVPLRCTMTSITMYCPFQLHPRPCSRKRNWGILNNVLPQPPPRKPCNHSCQVSITRVLSQVPSPNHTGFQHTGLS